MKYLLIESTDPAFNLVLEEQLFIELDKNDTGWFHIWKNRPSIIVGRNQNTVAEINNELV